MSVLYLQFEASDRAGRAAKLGKSGAHIVISEPRWPQFFELAKKEKPYAIAIDMSTAPSHCLETADYISKAKETRDTPLFLLRVPEDRLEAVKKRLPNAPIVTEQELAHTLVEEERKAQERAREKKEAAAAARKTARAKKLGLDAPPASGKTAKPPAKAAAAAPEKKKASSPAPKKKTPAAPAKKKSAARPPKKK
ncbi:MAG: hypothetical protein M3167_07015 [Acidobacteriota bacterium]|nr:hypothetical protein [Acidobacteriota bacterium]